MILYIYTHTHTHTLETIFAISKDCAQMNLVHIFQSEIHFLNRLISSITGEDASVLSEPNVTTTQYLLFENRCV